MRDPIQCDRIARRVGKFAWLLNDISDWIFVLTVEQKLVPCLLQIILDIGYLLGFKLIKCRWPLSCFFVVSRHHKTTRWSLFPFLNLFLTLMILIVLEILRLFDHIRQLASLPKCINNTYRVDWHWLGDRIDLLKTCGFGQGHGVDLWVVHDVLVGVLVVTDAIDYLDRGLRFAGSVFWFRVDQRLQSVIAFSMAIFSIVRGSSRWYLTVSILWKTRDTWDTSLFLNLMLELWLGTIELRDSSLQVRIRSRDLGKITFDSFFKCLVSIVAWQVLVA